MALDPRIPLGVQGPQVRQSDPLKDALDIQEARQKAQANAIALKEKQDQDQLNQWLDSAYKNYVDPDGSINYTKMAGDVAKGPHGHLAPLIEEQGGKVSEQRAKAIKARGEAHAAERDLAGGIGAGMQEIIDKGGPPEEAAAYGLTHIAALRHDGLMTDEEALGITKNLDPSNPDQLKRTISTMRAASKEQSTLDTARITANRPTQASLAMAASQGDLPSRQALELLKPPKDPTEKSIQNKTVLLDGKPAEINFNPAGGKWEFNGEEIDPNRVKPMPPASVIYPKAPGEEPLVKVEHKDMATGRTVIEYLPKSEIRGKTFEKGVAATVETRLASSQAVQQTGQDIIKQLSDPETASKIGPAMGRYNSVREWVGNPPPELSQLAGEIESYSLANMGVHGMRSVQGSELIRKLLDQKHTPESLISAITGLNRFSEHFLQNEGRPVLGGPSPLQAPTKPRKVYNPTTGKAE